MKSKSLFKVLFILIFLLLIGASSAALYFYHQYTTTNKAKLAAAQDMRDYMKVAGGAVLLPQEEPIAATVSDKNKLQSQAFFKSAQNGDKVFIYAKSGLAVLFRPSIGKIVQVSTIQVSDTVSAQATPSPSPLTVTIYNGTTTVGASKIAENILDTSIFSVTKRASAVKSDYPTTLVIDVTGGHGTQASQLATALGGQVSASVPPGEEKPSTDILIIVGKK